MARWNLAIKMGSAVTSIFLSGGGIVLSEPTMIAYSSDKKNRRVRAVGEAAYKMLGKAPESTTIAAPVVDGIIADKELSALLLREFINKLTSSISPKPRLNVIMSVPSGLNIEERKMYEEVCLLAGINSVTLVDSIILAAIGIDLPIEASIGRLVVNIGAGMTEMGVLSLCGVVQGRSFNIGGNMIDRALVDYIAGQYNLRISVSAAEKIKVRIGSLYPNDRSKIKITGLNISSNSLAEVDITAVDVMKTAEPYYEQIIKAIEGLINICQTDIAADINSMGIYVTGGASKILGLDGMISRALGLRVTVAEEPQFATIMGAGKLLSNDNLLNEILKQH